MNISDEWFYCPGVCFQSFDENAARGEKKNVCIIIKLTSCCLVTIL